MSKKTKKSDKSENKSALNLKKGLWILAFGFLSVVGINNIGDDVRRGLVFFDFKNYNIVSIAQILMGAPVKPEQLRHPDNYYAVIDMEETWGQWEENPLLKNLPNMPIGDTSVLQIVFGNNVDPIRPFSKRNGEYEVPEEPTKTIEATVIYSIGGIVKERNTKLISQRDDITGIYDFMQVNVHSSKVFWTNVVTDREYIHILFKYIYSFIYGINEDKFNPGVSIEKVIDDDGNVEVTVRNQYFWGTAKEEGSFYSEAIKGRLEDTDYGFIWKGDSVDPKKEIEENGKLTETYGTAVDKEISLNRQSYKDSVKFHQNNVDKFDNALPEVQAERKGRALVEAAISEALFLRSSITDEKIQEIKKAILAENPDRFQTIEDIGDVEVIFEMQIIDGAYRENAGADEGKVVIVNDLPDSSGFETDEDRTKWIDKVVDSGIFSWPKGYGTVSIVDQNKFNELITEELPNIDTGYTETKIFSTLGGSIKVEEIDNSKANATEEPTTGEQTTGEQTTGDGRYNTSPDDSEPDGPELE